MDRVSLGIIRCSCLDQDGGRRRGELTALSGAVHYTASQPTFPHGCASFRPSRQVSRGDRPKHHVRHLGDEAVAQRLEFVDALIAPAGDARDARLPIVIEGIERITLPAGI